MSTPLGPNGRWKTGQRVPFTGYFIDQHGIVSWHQEHRTFPPAIGRKGSVAYRAPYSGEEYSAS